MNELITIKKEIADDIYLQFRDFFLSKKNNPSFKYEFEQHNIQAPLNAAAWEIDFYNEVRPHYYNEQGTVTFTNASGNDITISILRWHPHKHNGINGLNGNACIKAKITIHNNGEENLIWQLIVTSGTLYYKAEVSNLQLPKEILKQNDISLER